MKLKRIISLIISAALACSMIFSAAAEDADNAVLRKETPDTAFSVSNNISDNNYRNWSVPVYSYLNENADGTFSKIEYSESNGCVYVEDYSSDMSLAASREIECELPLFGGFYSGSSYNFIVFGQANYSESSSAEIMRVVRYSKSWDRIDSFSAKGANTREPFTAGSLRMAETNGLLYVYTCHTMFTTDDGLNHQANMTFVIDTETMKEKQSYYDIMNISYGYVSHSFNQFIRTDGKNIYRADHGDAYLRGMSITKCSAGGSITDVEYTNAFPIKGNTGNNYTGASAGGFELSDSNCLIAGSSVDQSSDESFSSKKQRNIFLTVTDKNLKSTNTLWLTNYAEDSDISPRTPHMVKYGSDRFLIMWEEESKSSDDVCVKILSTDGNGNVISAAKKADIRLSDCQPLMTSDGLVKWYVTDSDKTILYSLDPFALESFTENDIPVSVNITPGDADSNGVINMEDAAIALSIYAKYSAGLSLDEFTGTQIKAADINADGIVNIEDAAEILKIYAQNAAGI
ncbi:MAG: dockerin type I repeat-containing protein [Ruminococcus sp.]